MDYTTLVAIAHGYFQACGLCPFTLNTTSSGPPRVDRLLCAWTVLHALVILAISVAVALRPSYVFFDNDPIGALTDVIQLVGPFFAHLVVLFEAVRTRHRRRRLRRHLLAADGALRRGAGVRVADSNRRGMLGFVGRAAGVHGVCVATEVHIIAAIGENAVWLHLWSVMLFTMIAVRSQHLLFVWHVDEVRWRLAVCAEQLQVVWISGGHGEVTNINTFT